MRASVMSLVLGGVVLVGCAGKPESKGDGQIEVTVLATSMTGSPLEGQPVLVHDAEGVFVRREATAVGGTVTMSVPAGAAVTVLHESDVVAGPGTFTQSTLRTFRGVQAGDTLRAAFFELDDAVVTPVVLGTANVAFPGTFGGATYYTGSFVGSCASTGTSDPTGVHPFPIQDNCLPPGSSLIPLALARDASLLPLAFSLGAPVAPATVYASTTTYPAWRTDWDALAVDVTGLPPGTFDVFLSLTQQDTASGYVYGEGLTATAGGGLASGTMDLLPLSYAYADWQLSVGSETTDGVSLLRTRSLGDLADLPVDASVLMGRIQSSSIAASGSSASIAWSASGVEPADELWAWTYWYDGGVVLPDLHFVQWFVSSPPESLSPFRLPDLPDEFATWRPSRVQTGFNLFLEYRERSDFDGWDAARNADPLLTPVTFVERISKRRIDGL